MNKWFRVSSNRSGSTHQLAGRAGFEDPLLGVGNTVINLLFSCDDVLNGAVLALVHRPVVFGLPLAQLCNQLVLLLPLLLGLDLGVLLFGLLSQ